MDEFEKIFEKLARQDDPNKIFNNFLDYVIHINLITKSTLEDLELKEEQTDYFNMFNAWIQITNIYLQNNPKEKWYDYLGLFYENVIQSKYKAGARGQFFTPTNVCESMARLTLLNPEDDFKGKIINDSSCGSGRLLLAAHGINPLAVCIGQDLDLMAVKMCVLNFYIHGVVGSVINMNSLSNEFFGAYRINKYLWYGVPVPHIEFVNYVGAHEFINIKGER